MTLEKYKSLRRKRVMKIFVLSIFFFILLWTGLYAVNTFVLKDRAIISTSVSGQDLSFKTAEEIDIFFNNFVANEIPLKIRLSVDGVETEIAKDEFNFVIDSQGIISNGKNGILGMSFATINNLKGSEANDFVKADLKPVFDRFWFKISKENAAYVDEIGFLRNCSTAIFDFGVDEHKLSRALWEGASELGEIKITSRDFLSNQDILLLDHCANYNSQIGYINELSSKLGVEESTKLFDYKLSSESKGWVLIDKELLDSRINEFKIKNDRQASDGQYEIINNQIYLLTPYIIGSILNIDSTNFSLEAWLQNPNTKMPFVFEESKPSILAMNLPIRDFTKLMGYGISGIDMDRDNRAGQAANAVAGFKEIQNIVVSPGQVFSFHNNLNYIPGTSKTAKGNFVGMGICTTVTTLFRAVLDAGLEVVERENHGEYIEKYRYNPNNGDPNNRDLVDATYFGDPRSIVDFKFKNNFSNDILLRNHVWYENGQQYHRVEIRSAESEPLREVWLGNWRISNRRSSRVFNSYFDRVVKIGDQVVLQDSYFSDYQR